MEALRSAECPTCLNVFHGKIFQCSIGHSICESCAFCIEKCPICGLAMTHMRNFALEAVIEESKTITNKKTIITSPKTSTTSRPKSKDAVCPSSPRCLLFQADKLDPVAHMQTFHYHKLVISVAHKTGIKITKAVSQSFGEENFFKVIFDKEKFFKLFVSINHVQQKVYFSMKVVNDVLTGKFEVDYQSPVRSKKYVSTIMASDAHDYPFVRHAVAIPKDLCCRRINDSIVLVVYLNVIF
ncbi:hypothetical protein RI129_008669 [Pyrocoelia pectoralis]|uniref:E3 ubiquitin-protein ligase Sina-like RING finger domain-containing protein n=1 Tax=Pyrocoelia pectoralis TaxID=417401 RepID=A0AAN7ZHK8_9COLE